MINLKFTLQKRNGTYATPIIKNITKRGNIHCMVDTGAMLPIWCSTESELLNVYPSAHKIDAISFVRGFGKDYEIAFIYNIPDFELSDGKNIIHFINLIVGVVNKDFTFDMILSYTMLNKMNVGIDTVTNIPNEHYLEQPNIKLVSLKDKYNVGVRQKSFLGPNKDILINRYNTEKIFSDIYVFAQ